MIQGHTKFVFIASNNLKSPDFMRTLTVLLFLFCSLFSSQATELSVSGKVLFGENLEPVAEYEVALFLLPPMKS